MIKIDDDSVEFTVKNVQVRGGFVIHIGVIEGTLKTNDKVALYIDESRRRLIMNNHTGTHILNYALRKVLDTETDQRGSLVAPDRLRFDFTNKTALTTDAIKNTEICINECIKKNEQVYAKESNLAIAKTIKGLRAVFDETYPDPVRIVSVGVPIETLENDPFGQAAFNTSVEFCGGTHLKYSGHIGDFVIASEEAIAKGIRRIVALTGPEALKALKKTESLENKLNTLKTQIQDNNNGVGVKNIVDLIEEISAATIPAWKKDELRNSLKQLKKNLDDKERAAKAAIANNVVEEIKEFLKTNPDLSLIVKELKAFNNTKALDSALKQVKTLSPNASALFITVDQDTDKIFCLASVSKVAIDKGLKANEWVNTVAAKIGGKGGGKPDSAQASGKNSVPIDEILKLAKDFADQKLL